MFPKSKDSFSSVPGVEDHTESSQFQNEDSQDAQPLVLDSTVPPSYFKGYKNFQADQLEFADTEGFISSLDVEYDLSTLDVLKVHSARLVLVIIYVCYLYFESLESIYEQGLQALNVVFQLLSWHSLMHLEKVLMIGFKLVNLQFFDSEIQAVSLLFELLPLSLVLPKSITYVEYSEEILTPAPPPVCRPILGYNKEVIMPTETEIAKAAKLRNEYFNEVRIHHIHQALRILNNFSKLVVWCCFLGVEVVNLELDVSYVYLRSMMYNEVEYQLSMFRNYDIKVLRSLIPIIRIKHGEEEMMFDPMDTIVTDGEDQSEWTDDNRRELTVVLGQQSPVGDLTLLPNANRVSFKGYHPPMYFLDTFIYNSKFPFSFKLLIDCLYEYSKNQNRDNK